MLHVVFDRHLNAVGVLAEGSLACLSCRATQEIDAQASKAEGEVMRLDFEGRHARCATSFVAEPDTGEQQPVHAVARTVEQSWQIFRHLAPQL